MKKTKRSKSKKKMPLYQIQGIKIFDMLESIRSPKRQIKDAVKWLHANR